jgi:hypothetical protein
MSKAVKLKPTLREVESTAEMRLPFSKFGAHGTLTALDSLVRIVGRMSKDDPGCTAAADALDHFTKAKAEVEKAMAAIYSIEARKTLQ